jgi:hypothetical protein
MVFLCNSFSEKLYIHNWKNSDHRISLQFIAIVGIEDFEFFMPLQLSGVRLPERTDSGNASVDESQRKNNSPSLPGEFLSSCSGIPPGGIIWYSEK